VTDNKITQIRSSRYMDSVRSHHESMYPLHVSMCSSIACGWVCAIQHYASLEPTPDANAFSRQSACLNMGVHSADAMQHRPEAIATALVEHRSHSSFCDRHSQFLAHDIDGLVCLF